MRPTDKSIEKFREVFTNNLDLVVACFEEDTSHFPKEIQQEIVDIMFLTFIMGMMQPMSPGSKFNTEYKA